MEPIVGVRWKCLDCPGGIHTDLCSRCKETDFENDYHSKQHHLEAVRFAEVYYQDDDYSEFVGEYSYLDPVGRARCPIDSLSNCVVCRTLILDELFYRL